MIRLSDGDVRQSDVMRWAQEQAVFLSPPSLHHVLLYLCLNAFYTEKNREDRKPGNVLTGRTRLRTITKYTGLSQATVRRALQGLQDNCYVVANMSPGGWEQNSIFIAWSGQMDDHRNAVRAGKEKPLKVFRRVEDPASGVKPVKPVPTDAVVLQFPPRSI